MMDDIFYQARWKIAFEDMLGELMVEGFDFAFSALEGQKVPNHAENLCVVEGLAHKGIRANLSTDYLALFVALGG